MDILDDLRQRLLAVMPEAGPALVQVLPQVRDTWGGGNPYIKKSDAYVRTETLALALRQRQPLREAFATAGVSRANGYRMLARPAKQRR